MTVRVVAGALKGRRLRTTPNMRPTTDQARRTLFDILGDVVEGARVLDLFAGAGTLGIEALSRGADRAVFVERDRGACAVIEQNLAATEMRARAEVHRADASRFLARTPRAPFDLAFLDPPYDAGLGFLARVLGRLASGWIRPGGTVVVEAEAGAVGWPAGYRETKTRRFGRTQLSMAVFDGERGDLPGDV